MGLFRWILDKLGVSPSGRPPRDEGPSGVPARIRRVLPQDLSDFGEGGVRLYQISRATGDPIDLGPKTPSALDRLVRAAARALVDPPDEERAEAARELLVRGAGVLLGTHVVETLGGSWRVDDFGVTVAGLGRTSVALDPFTAVRRALRDPERWSLDGAIRELRDDMDGTGPRARFQREFLERLGAEIPERSVAEVRWLEVRFEDGLRLHLGNLYEDVAETPDRRGELIERYINQLRKVPFEDDEPTDFDTVAERVVPQLKPSSFLSVGGGAAPIHTPFRNGLIVVYAIEDDASLRFLGPADLARWGIEKRDVRRTARRNLRRASPELRLQEVGLRGAKVFAVAHGDGLDAVRILLPDLHARLAAVVGSPFLAAVPHRDALIVLPAKDRGLRRALVPRLRAAAAASRNGLTGRLFKVCPDGLEEFRDD